MPEVVEQPLPEVVEQPLPEVAGAVALQEAEPEQGVALLVPVGVAEELPL